MATVSQNSRMVKIKSEKQKVSRQNGVALVTALLIVSLATIMAVSLVSRQYIDVRRTGNIMLSDQAYLYSLAMENFAGQLLAFYRDKGKSTFDDRAEFEAAMLQFSAFPVEGGTVSVSVSYPGAMFNVNTLIDGNGNPVTKQKERYERLLASVLTDLNFGTGQVDELSDALLDWLDPDDNVRAIGAEDGTYESKDSPYKAANTMMTSISELRLVEGYSHDILYGFPEDENNPAIPGLLSYVTALPDRETKLNVNLVTEPKQFFALSDLIDDQMAKDLLVDSDSYDSIAQIKNSTALENVSTQLLPGQTQTDKQKIDAALTDMTDVQSLYFMLKGVATVGQARIDLNSLIYVSKNGTKLEVISRSIGTAGI